MDTAATPNTEFLTYAEVRELTGLSRKTITRRRHEGNFPLPVRLGIHQNRIHWRRSDIEAWMASCAQVDTPAEEREDIGAEEGVAV